ncbi:MAG: MBL fold metallo-hydrolase [Lachnospiraceae bacterium]|nr:MBL fold metallo-hydrolase [Lachnospiraceae bacterium]
MVQILKYGNTNTYYIASGTKGLLVDTAWAGTLPAFFKEIKRKNIKVEDIGYLLITHYHPDHMGIAGELVELGVCLLVMDLQQDYVHSSDAIFAKDDRMPFKPISLERATVISCAESRAFLKKLGIDGEILATPGHSEDSVSVVLDEGIAIVGDLYPLDSVLAYQSEVLEQSWNALLSKGLQTVYYGHAKEFDVRGRRA